MDHLGFVQPVDRLGEGVVVGISDTAHRGHHAGVGEAFGVADVLECLSRPLQRTAAPSGTRYEGVHASQAFKEGIPNPEPKGE